MLNQAIKQFMHYRNQLADLSSIFPIAFEGYVREGNNLAQCGFL